MTGQEETASSSTRGGLDWLLGKKKISCQKDCQALEQAAQAEHLNRHADMTLGDRVYWWTCSTGLMAGFIDLKGLLKPK